jgi:radical SAM superfamily enzyme YgiQ (UPF0313 family)
MYKAMDFEIRPSVEILMDIETARRAYGDGVSTVFIGDSDSLIAGEGLMLEVLEYLRWNFPHLKRVTTYARVRTLCKTSPDALRRLRDAGLTRLHVGLESGDEETLREIRKGASTRQMIEGALRAKDAGLEVSLYVLLGIGGQRRWRAHAEGTADVLNRIGPHFIRVRTYTPTPNSPLHESTMRGEFELASPETILREQRLIIERLEATSYYLSDHISNFLPVEGRIPHDKPAMLGLIDDSLRRLKEDAGYRSSLERMRHLIAL